MVGTFPNVPGPRIPYDRNIGAILHGGQGTPGASTILYTHPSSATTLANGNDEANNFLRLTASGTNPFFGVLVLPEPYDIVGYALRLQATSISLFTLMTSVDTTDGSNGTWVERVASPVPVIGIESQVSLRTVQVVSWPGARAVRIQGSGAQNPDVLLSTLHVYGAPSAAALTANPHRLRLWHPTLDQPLGGADLDFGDAKQGVTVTKNFRVKNNSATQTANTITLSREVLTDLTPATLAEYTLSFNAGAFGATAAVGNLAAGAISAVCSVRRAIAGTALVSPVQARLIAAAASWT